MAYAACSGAGFDRWMVLVEPLVKYLIDFKGLFVSALGNQQVLQEISCEKTLTIDLDNKT